MGKVLGIDYGNKRVGLAISDDEKILAVVLGVVERIRENIWEALAEIIRNQQIELIVIGLPISMAGASTPQTMEVEQFIDECRSRFEIPVDTMDERLSSIEADSLARDMKKYSRDAISALLILQSYLDSHQKSIR